MKPSPIEQSLLSAFEQFEIVDAHEHLPPEEVRTNQKVDVLTLFAHYTRTDIITSGMSPQNYDRMINPELPLDERWRMFSPYLEQIKYGSYARPAFIAAKEFYGFDDISDETYEGISAAMTEANKPGIYHRILREKCHIRTALTQANRTDYNLDLLVPLMPLDTYAAVRSWEEIERRAHDLGLKVNTLDDYIGVMEEGIVQWKSQGVVGLKMVSRIYGEPSRAEAMICFEQLRTGTKTTLTDLNPMRDFLMEKMLDIVASHDMVVAVHTGMWGDFRTLHPTHMIPVIQRHPNTRFDVYHAGMPWVREAGVIGKNFANVWLNLCWCHIISPRMTCSALDEWIDMVPVNKIIAFGGDYRTPVEKVYGHLTMARQDIARVLAGRVEEGLMSEDEAFSVAKKWFYDNPKELYRLDI